MPTPTATAPAKSSAPGGQTAKPAAPVMVVPFTRAGKEHIEPFVDVSVLIDANTHVQGPYDIPAYGYMRHVVLLAEATGGVASVTVAAQEDAPWIAIADLQLADVNGAPIVGPINGYDLYLVNKYGGYQFIPDPKQLFSFSAVAVGASASGNFAFSLRIPVEICNRDGLGAIANQNASSTYKLKFTQNSSANIYSTAPNTTLPTIRWRAYLEAWSQPPATDLRGHAQATTPPAHGTSSYWSKISPTPSSGQQTIRLARVGNYLRNIIFVNRDNANGTRATGETDFPDPAQLFWDTRLLHNYTKKIWRDMIARRTGLGMGGAAIETAGGLDNGVFVYDWCHEFDGKLGNELRDGWLPSVQSTRLEIQGQWALASKLDIITNDVAPAGEVFVG
jgi:hypothetical protein